MENEIVEVPQGNQVATTQPDAMLEMIDRVCADPGFDITKMEKLIEMRNAELSRVAEIDFNRAFAEMQPHLPKVISTHYNDQTKSKYSKIDDINIVVCPVLSEYGFGVSFKIASQDDKGVTVRAVLRHSAGHQDSTDLFMPYDSCGVKGTVNKTPIHATGSTISYAKRYAMCMLLDISTGQDNDGNNNADNFITPDQAVEINDLIDETGANWTDFVCNYMGVEKVEKISSKGYRRAINALQAKKRQIEKDKENANS